MTKRLEIGFLLMGALCAMALTPRWLEAQACNDDEAMVESYRKDLSDLVDTTRKENLEQFEKAFHQRACLTKLSLALGLVKELEGCLEKAGQDPAAAKELSDSDKAKHEKYAKLQGKIEQDQKNLKAAQEPKDAKSVIGKFDFSDN
jgi:hypothetical protein